MKDTPKYESREPDVDDRDLLALNEADDLTSSTERQVHLLSKGIICTTDSRARKLGLRLRSSLTPPRDLSRCGRRIEVLRWKFNEASLAVFRRPEAVKSTGQGIAHGSHYSLGNRCAYSLQRKSRQLRLRDRCRRIRKLYTPQGCILAQAFFPDAGRHQLFVFPTMFQQSKKEQVDTLAHEIGHVFGLRHFFAPEAWRRRGRA